MKKYFEINMRPFGMVVANKTDSFQKLQLETGRKETSLSLFSSRKFIYFETGWELLFDI